MSILKKWWRGAESPKPRIRICVECGMPIAEHKHWCSILRGQLERDLRADTSARPAAPGATEA